MKKIILALISILLLSQLTSCKYVINRTDKTPPPVKTDTINESTKEIDKIDESETSETDEFTLVKNEHFSVKIPKEWETMCVYEIEEKSISFYHKKSYDYCLEHYGYPGGYLFSIDIQDLNYFCDVGDSAVLGGLSIPGMGEFNVWKGGPSDVQYPLEEYGYEYRLCVSEIASIISTLTFNKEYHFCKTPYEFDILEHY